MRPASACLLFLFAAAPALHAAPFLVPDKPWRCASDQISAPRFTVNFVEFRDNGAPWCPIQLTDALHQIEKSRADNPDPVVLVYIHGWKNDANEDLSGDVTKFRHEVERLALVRPAPGAGKAPAFVGIYIAWRGLTLTLEPFKTLSYWPRRAVARRVGTTGVYDAVGQIVDKVGDTRENRARTTLLFVGHSFGARVLENAADAAGRKPGFMNRHLLRMQQRQLARTQSLLTDETAPQPPADLIVYVNAATASTVTRRTIREWKGLCAEGSDSPVCTAHPFWLAFTSTADLATRIIMPIANAVFPALTSDGLHLISAANTSSLHTHNVPSEPCSPNRKPDDFRCPPGSKSEACFGVIQDTSKYCYEVQSTKTPPPPFWIMNVDSHISSGHTDIWNPGVVNLILAIMHQQTNSRIQ